MVNTSAIQPNTRTSPASRWCWGNKTHRARPILEYFDKKWFLWNGKVRRCLFVSSLLVSICHFRKIWFWNISKLVKFVYRSWVINFIRPQDDRKLNVRWPSDKDFANWFKRKVDFKTSNDFLPQSIGSRKGHLRSGWLSFII